MEKKIMELQDIKTFWHDVKVIVGYYENKEWEDWQIKQFQRIADYRYEQLKEMNKC